MNETVTPSKVNAPAGQGPGQRLAEARKARGISLEEVASQLRLSVSTLRALENDDRSHLPPAAYVSGYLRGYARIVGLSEQELAQAQAQAVSAMAAEPPAMAAVSRAQTKQVRATDPSMRLASYIVVGGFLLVSSVWWLAQRESPSETAATQEPAQEMAQPPVQDPMAVSESGTEVGTAPEVPSGSGEPGEAVVAPGSLPAPVETTMAGTTTAGTTTAGTPAAETPVPAETAATMPAEAEAPVAAAPPKPLPPPPPPLTADTPQSKVRLQFTEDCWVSLKDKAGRQLAYQTYSAGTTVTLRGEAPFRVFFGYSPGVQVFFNDQRFDHQPFQRRETASFRLGSAGDNVPATEAN